MSTEEYQNRFVISKELRDWKAWLAEADAELAAAEDALRECGFTDHAIIHTVPAARIRVLHAKMRLLERGIAYMAYRDWHAAR